MERNRAAESFETALRRETAWIGLAFGLLGCTNLETTDEHFFEGDRRVEVAVELDPSDWATLREEGRGLSDFMSNIGEYEYTNFDGTVTIDGHRYEQVKIRKKGFLGSLSAIRPSLKISLDNTIEGQNHLGLRGLTLNNDRQDPSHTHQCMAYRMFARAGLPASRCNLAHVVVNGEDLGTYSNVEPVNKAFLTRNFERSDGNLYEGSAADVDAASIDRLELKTNEEINDRSDVLALSAALDTEDSALMEHLSAQLDVDQFRDYWAMETLTGHWDSYSGNSNNYFMYRNPSSERFVFIPWGTDAAFETFNVFDSVNRSIVVYANGRIANRLYRLPEERDRYRARLAELNESVWNVDVLLEEVRQVEALAPDASAAALALQRERIQTHPDALRAALSEPAPEWVDNTRGFTGPCLGMLSDVRGSFGTVFGQLESPTPGNSQLELSVDGSPIQLTWLVSSGISPDDAAPRIRYLAPLAEGRYLVAEFVLPSSRFKPGSWRCHGGETGGALGIFSELEGFRFIGWLGDGTIDLNEASLTPGAAVIGSFTGKLLQVACGDLP